jgi:hypothetical protein
MPGRRVWSESRCVTQKISSLGSARSRYTRRKYYILVSMQKILLQVAVRMYEKSSDNFETQRTTLCRIGQPCVELINPVSNWSRRGWCRVGQFDTLSRSTVAVRKSTESFLVVSLFFQEALEARALSQIFVTHLSKVERYSTKKPNRIFHHKNFPNFAKPLAPHAPLGPIRL